MKLYLYCGLAGVDARNRDTWRAGVRHSLALPIGYRWIFGRCDPVLCNFYESSGRTTLFEQRMCLIFVIVIWAAPVMCLCPIQATRVTNLRLYTFQPQNTFFVVSTNLQAMGTNFPCQKTNTSQITLGLSKHKVKMLAQILPLIVL